MIINRASPREYPPTHALAAYSADTARRTARNLTHAPKRRRQPPQNEGKKSSARTTHPPHQQHNFDVVPDTDCVLRGPFGDSTTPAGATQGHIAIEDASATIGVEVVNDLPHDAVIGTDWRECVAFDYIERYTNGTHTLEWIPKDSPPETPEMEHRKNITPQPAHKDDNEETDVTSS
ncbi:hypothetical protein HPB50_022440 [Hyalomma asiaticum]|uniref:Uncharacterized protein n=1 Tax=Hyalomma asiaticum TaxID=266040 RepID=A0ACB7TPF9_HYAAI|nr:hypothetical protein HPB50_022440 [Hyalomma asiaticum]